MTDLREAAQMALEALDSKHDMTKAEWRVLQYHAFTALRVALANEFNPDWDAMAVMVEEQQRMAKRIEELESALAQPEREWQRLTDEEVVARANEEGLSEAFARGVAWAELKLKEKNT